MTAAASVERSNASRFAARRMISARSSDEYGASSTSLNRLRNGAAIRSGLVVAASHATFGSAQDDHPDRDPVDEREVRHAVLDRGIEALGDPARQGVDLVQQDGVAIPKVREMAHHGQRVFERRAVDHLEPRAELAGIGLGERRLSEAALAKQKHRHGVPPGLPGRDRVGPQPFDRAGLADHLVEGRGPERIGALGLIRAMAGLPLRARSRAGGRARGEARSGRPRGPIRCLCRGSQSGPACATGSVAGTVGFSAANPEFGGPPGPPPSAGGATAGGGAGTISSEVRSALREDARRVVEELALPVPVLEAVGRPCR